MQKKPLVSAAAAAATVASPGRVSPPSATFTFDPVTGDCSRTNSLVRA